MSYRLLPITFFIFVNLNNYMSFENHSWFVNKNKVRTDYPKIENLSQFLIQDIPNVHPDHPEYVKFWSKETKKCIEGIWKKEWGKYRYMPGNLYFFGNYGVIKHTWEEDGVKLTKFIKPLILDYIWEFAAMSYACYGFSGFSNDTEYSCNIRLRKYLEGEISDTYVPSTCYHEGKLKKYVDAYEYLLKLHDVPLGKPLFQNEAIDGMIMGTRRGGKSYWVAIGEMEYNYVFSGARRYTQEFINQEYSCAQVIGSADTDKSSDLLSKFTDSQDAKINASNKDFKKWFGIWEEHGFDERGKDFTIITPCPFYKRSSGNLNCPNKKNPYTSNYKVEMNGQWKTKGDGNQIFHVNYSSKKGAGAQAAVGNSYLFSAVEETGLVDNATEIYTSNDSATKRGSKFGVQLFYGTSGNIEYVLSSKKMFLGPKDYSMISFNNKFSEQGKNNEIGYFIPKYMVLLDFKDKNGNTDYDAAIDFVNQGRKKASMATDTRVLRDHLMNEPCFVPEMWLTDKGYYLPYEEAAERERELMVGQLYKDIGHDVELVWTNDNKVVAKQLHDFVRICDWPIPKDLKDPSGCIVIYEYPEDNCPNDMYCFVGHDPYVEEDIDFGGSLGTTYILKNPKYISSGHTGNIIVASYIGKPVKGLKYYYEQQEKLLAFYGNPNQGLWYEKNRGEVCREYYMNNTKANLLCLTPDRTQGGNIYQRNIQSFGYNVGNRVSKLNLLRMLHDWLLEETTLMENGLEITKKNIFRIPCIFLIRQIMDYKIDENYDAVSGFIGCILGLRERAAREEQYAIKSKETKLFENLLKNKNIFQVYSTSN